MPSQHAPATPKIIAKACTLCRTRKIRCDAVRPRCSSCVSQNRECGYSLDAPRRRPTIAQIEELRGERARLEAFIATLKSVSPEERLALLDAVMVSGRHVRVPPCPPNEHEQGQLPAPERPANEREYTHADDHRAPAEHDGTEVEKDSSGEEPDLALFAAVDETGIPSSFGPSSALNQPSNGGISRRHHGGSEVNESVRNGLIANAALQRQQEYALASLPDIHGVPNPLALHLLDIHWSRQHHTFPLTYRPAIMRDLATNGPHCSDFLLYAIFAWSSKLSNRLDVRDNPSDPSTAGRRFFRRCDELLAEQTLLTSPTIPTIMALLLLGSTYNARGETSKGWLHTGYATRMVFDLGLHLDPKEGSHSPEEAEIRRRVFWAAFICDKLQSLYLGRPITINLRDAHVSRDFQDTFEELELWRPHTDRTSALNPGSPSFRPTMIHSVSTFQQFCLLSRIMTKIINRFYVVGASSRNAKAGLQAVDDALQNWKHCLPKDLHFEPHVVSMLTEHYPSPNIMNLHATFYSLIILLHRPFISDGHLRLTTAPEVSWKRCTSAAKSITSIVLAYRTAYTLQAAPYILSYALYVASTIHVRNAAAERNRARDKSSMLASSLRCLDELCKAIPGVKRPVSIIRRLMATNGLSHDIEETVPDLSSTSPLDLDAILATFPANSSNNSPVPGSSNYTYDSAQAPSDTTAPFRAVGESRMAVDNANPSRLDYFDFQDPLYGHMDGSMASFYDMYDVDFGRNNQI